MSKIAMLIGGLTMMCTTLVAAAPQATTLQPTPKAASQASQPLPWESQQSTQVCNLLCIQGYHCCIIHRKATCVPDTQACP